MFVGLGYREDRVLRSFLCFIGSLGFVFLVGGCIVVYIGSKLVLVAL